MIWNFPVSHITYLNDTSKERNMRGNYNSIIPLESRYHPCSAHTLRLSYLSLPADHSAYIPFQNQEIRLKMSVMKWETVSLYTSHFTYVKLGNPTIYRILTDISRVMLSPWPIPTRFW